MGVCSLIPRLWSKVIHMRKGESLGTRLVGLHVHISLRSLCGGHMSYKIHIPKKCTVGYILLGDHVSIYKIASTSATPQS